MRDYDDCRVGVHPYFDGEIKGQELKQFRHHLSRCEACQTELKVITELSRLLHRSRPLYSAPNDLRNRLICALQNHLL
jgi:anti-sigma factor RsiW